MEKNNKPPDQDASTEFDDISYPWPNDFNDLVRLVQEALACGDWDKAFEQITVGPSAPLAQIKYGAADFVVREVSEAIDGGGLKAVKNLRMQYDQAANSQDYHDFIIDKLYPDEKCLTIKNEKKEHRFSCAIYTPPDNVAIENHADSFVGEEKSPDAPDLTRIEAHRENYRRLNGLNSEKYFNGKTIALTELQTEPTLRIHYNHSCFFDYRACAEPLKWELQRTWLKSRNKLRNSDEPLQLLPLRKRLDDHIKGMGHSSVTRYGHGRAAGMGVSTLICFRDHETGQYGVFTLKTSPEKATAGVGRRSVAPSGMYERLDDFTCEFADKGPVSLWLNFLKEYAEELDPEELKNRKSKDNPRVYFEIPSVEYLREQLEGDASFHLTSVSANLSDNLGLDITCLLMIHDPEWSRAWLPKLRTNWEYKKRHMLMFSIPITCRTQEEFTDDFIFHFRPIPTQWVNPGICATWFGTRLAWLILRQQMGESTYGMESTNSVVSATNKSTPLRIENSPELSEENLPAYVIENLLPDGSRCKPEPCDVANALQKAEESAKTTDVVIDEVNQQIRIQHKPSFNYYGKLSDPARGLLWLYLTNRGKSMLYDEELYPYFKLPVTKDSGLKKSRDNYIHKARMNLKKECFGEDLDKVVVSRATNRQIEIGIGWSLCWIRPWDIHESRLKF